MNYIEAAEKADKEGCVNYKYLEEWQITYFIFSRSLDVDQQ